MKAVKRRRGEASNALLAGLLVIAIGLGALVWIRRARAKPIWVGSRMAARADHWRRFDNGRLVIGPPHARNTIVVFADFECPACRYFANAVDSVRRADPTALRVVFRHLPNPRHPLAFRAAKVAECGAAQGRFKQLHDALFAAQERLTDSIWPTLARDAGVPDVARFTLCLDQDSAANRAVAADSVAARTARITATPTFLVNGLMFTGALGPTTLSAVLEGSTARR